MAGEDAHSATQPPEEGAGRPPARHGCFRRELVLFNEVTSPGCLTLIVLTGVFVATPLGMVVLGLTAAWFAVLWLHPRFWPDSKLVPWIILAPCGLYLPLLLWYDRAAAWQWLLFVALVGLLAFQFRRLAKRRQWQPRPLPRLSPSVLVLANGIGALLGLAAGLFIFTDGGPQEFPALDFTRPAVADAENGYVALAALVDSHPIDREQGRRIHDAWGETDSWSAIEAEGQWEEVRALLGEWEGAVRGFDRVLSRPRFVVPWPDESDDAAWLPPGGEWTDELRPLGRLKALQSSLMLVDGQAEEAMDAALGLFLLGTRLIQDAECLITYYVGCSVATIGLDQIRWVAAKAPLTPESLKSLSEGLEVAEVLHSGLRKALAGELLAEQRRCRAFVRGYADARTADSERTVHLFYRLFRRPLLPFLKPNMTVNGLGQDLTALLGEGESPPREQPRDWEGFSSMVAYYGVWQFLRNPAGVILAETMPWAYGWGTARAQRDLVAQQRLTRLLVLLRCHHLEHGALPDAVDELAPEDFEQVPLDPFTEEPFRYEPAGDTPRLYSVGPDQQPDPDVEDTDDIVVELIFAHPDNRE